MNTQPTHLSNEHLAQQSVCLCHNAICCPDTATVTFTAAELAHLHRLLGELDEFLRSGPAIAALLAEVYVTRGRPDGRYEANLLIDQIGFAAAGLQTRLAVADAGQPGADQ